MELMTIGAFADRTRLSSKALRLYDQLGLLSPAQVDPATGYRYYGEDQVERARLVGLLRRLDMPLVVITDILGRPSKQAAEASAHFGRPRTFSFGQLEPGQSGPGMSRPVGAPHWFRKATL
jgi:DNA-binding transcriptional MerR regulator